MKNNLEQAKNAFPVAILFIHLGDNWITGSESVLLNILKYLPGEKFLPILWCNSEILCQAAENIGVTTYRTRFSYFFTPESSRFRLRHYISLVADCVRLINTHNIKLIHCNGASPLQWSVPASIAKNVPILGYIHSEESRRKRFVFLTHFASHLVVLTKQARQLWLSDGLQNDRISVVFNGIDECRFLKNEISSINIPSKQRISQIDILQIGSLLKLKGHDLLLEAIAKLIIDKQDVRLFIAGDGPELEALTAQAKKLNIADRVYFLGRISNPKILYTSVDLMVLPSRSEAFPLVLLEAAYFAVPVIATRIGGIPEIIIDGVTGKLIEPDSRDALVDAIKEFIDNPFAARSLAEKSNQQYHQLFQLDAMINSIICIYETLLSTQIHPIVRILSGLNGLKIKMSEIIQCCKN
jgi:glycosyltransferase involved in cell wall biosynthesis